MKFPSFVFLFLIVTQHSFAEDTADNAVNFKTSANLGFRTFNFEQNFDQGALLVNGNTFAQPAKRTADYTVDFKSVELTMALAWRQIYATLNYETSIDTQLGTYDASYTPLSGGNPPSHGEASFDFKRNDYALTVGWNVIDNFSLFTGYKAGKTDTSRPATTYDPNLNQSIQSNATTTFKEDGPFIGASYSWIIGHGTLTFSSAWAYMNGNFQSAGEEVIIDHKPPPVNTDYALTQQALNYNGHTNGLSFNLSWNVQATNNIGYYYGAKYQRYNFDANTDVTWKFYDRNALPATIYTIQGPGSVKNTETVTAFYAGVNYTF